MSDESGSKDRQKVEKDASIVSKETGDGRPPEPGPSGNVNKHQR